MRRRSITIVGVCVLALVAASCGSDGPTAEGDGSVVSDTGAASTSAAKPAEPVTLRVSDFAGSAETDAAQDALDAAFMEANPDIIIDRSTSPFNEHFTKLTTAIAAQDGMDVAFAYPGAVAAEYEKGLLPLDDYLASSLDLQENLQFLTEARGTDGNLYVMPFMNYTYAFAVNRSVMTDAGLDPNPQPATWNDLLELCDSLNAAGVTPFAAGWQDGFYYDWFQFIFTNQTVSQDELEQMTRGELPFDSVGFLKAEEYIKEMVDRDCFNDDAIGTTLGEVSGIWESGGAAIQLAYFADQAWAETLGEDGVGFFLLPELDDNRWGAYPTSDAGPNGGWAITSWSENPDAAWRYISFMLSAESQTTYASFGGGAPNHVKASATSDVAFMNDYFALTRLPENHTTYLSMPVSVQATHQRNAISFINGDVTPAEVVAQLEEERQLILSE